MDGLSEDPTESLSLLEKAIQDIERFAQHEEYGEARALLEAQANFNQALLQAKAGNFAGTIEPLENAAKVLAS